MKNALPSILVRILKEKGECFIVPMPMIQTYVELQENFVVMMLQVDAALGNIVFMVRS